MATLEKIRSRSVLLIVIIGAALIAFIIGDFFTSGRTLFGTGTTVAKVDGQSIDIQEFQRQVEQASQQAQNQGQKVDQAVLQQQVLNNMVAQRLFDEEIKALGLTVTDAELTDAMLGRGTTVIDQMVQQRYGMPVATLRDMYDNPAKYNIPAEQQAQVRQAWMALENDVEKQLIQSKFNSIFQGTLVANELDAKALYDENATTTRVAYALKPFTSLPDDDAKYAVTDEEIQAEWSAHKQRYALDEQLRSISYLTVPIQPSDADIKAGEARINEAVAALNDKPELEGLAGNDEFVAQRQRVPLSQIRDTKLRSFADSAAVGTAKVINRMVNDFTVGKLLSRNTQVDSVNVDILRIQGTRAQIDSVLTALNSGVSTADVTKKYESIMQGNQDSLWISMLDPNIATVKDVIAAAPVAGAYFLADTAALDGQIANVMRVNQRRAAVPVVEIAVFDYTIDPSAATIAKLQSDLQKFLDQNPDTKTFAANAPKAGYSIFPTQVSVSTPQITGLPESREAIRWAMEAKKGQVSPIFGDEQKGRFLVVALEEVYDDYMPATNSQVKQMLTAKLRNDKKAADLIAQYQGKAKDVAGYAQLMNATVDSAAMNFGQYTLMYPDFAGPEVAARASMATKGQVVGPMQANNGVVVLQVTEVENAGRPYDFRENATMFARSRGAMALGQFLPNILQGKKKVKNNILKFYRD